MQVLADRIFVKNSLVRGEYNRAWNEVWLSEDALNVSLTHVIHIQQMVQRFGFLCFPKQGT